MSSKYIDGNTYAISGYTLSGVFQSITIGPAGTIGGPGIVGGTTKAYTIVNRGRVSGAANGVFLQDGGVITNSGSASLITGRTGVRVEAGAASIVNFGSIGSSFNGVISGGKTSHGYGIYLGAAGTIANEVGASIYASGAYAVGIELRQKSTVENAGTIEADAIYGVGILEAAGGVVTNDAAGLISGYTAGVSLGMGGSVTNAGTIKGIGNARGGFAVSMASGDLTNENGALLYGGVHVTTARGTVTNDGTIIFSEVLLSAGGLVTNSQHAVMDQSGGVHILGASGTVINQGTIGAYPSGSGINLGYGGLVENEGTSALIQSSDYGIFISGAVGTVMNAGTVRAGAGVELAAGGSVVNGGNGDSSAYIRLIRVSQGAGTVKNYGNIAGLFLYDGGLVDNFGVISYGPGVEIKSAASVFNSGTIESDLEIYSKGSAFIITNDGLVDTENDHKPAIYLHDGGNLTNAAGASIEGYSVIKSLDASATISNAGSIFSTSPVDSTAQYTAINLTGGGIVTNLEGGLVSGYSGISISGIGSVDNAGTIVGRARSSYYPNGGIYLAGSGSVTNGVGGLIAGFTGITITGAGAVSNAGTVDGTGGISIDFKSNGYVGNAAGALIEGAAGVVFSSAGTLINHGMIEATGSGASGVALTTGILTNDGTIKSLGSLGYGVRMLSAPLVVNAAGALIEAYGGIQEEGYGGGPKGGGSVRNAGTIEGIGSKSFGIDLVDTESLTNSAGGLIEANRAVIGSVSLVSNAGRIQGIGAGSVGVYLDYNEIVVNNAQGLISGSTAVDAAYADGDTVVNAGTIASTSGSGGTAVLFTKAGNSLVDDSGATFIGHVIGADGTLELSGTHGKLTGLGTSFSGFGTVDVLAGASWTFTGADAVASSLHDSGSLTLDGAVTVAGALSGAGTLILADDETFASGTHLTVSDVSLVGGSATLRTNLAYAGAFGESGGVAVVSGETLALTGAASFAGGAVAGDGFLETHGTVSLAALEVAGDAVWRDFGTVSESGTLTLGGTGGGSGRLTTEAGALFDITGNGGIEVTAGGSGMIINTGLLEKTSGTGTSVLAPAIDNTGTLKAQVGTLELAGAVTGTGTLRIGIGGTLRLDAAVASTETVTFSSTAGTLILHDPSGGGLGFSGLITSFGSADRLDLATFAYSGKPKVSWIQSGGKGTLTVTDGKDVAKITLFGQYAAAGFKPANDGGGGTVVTYTAPTGQAALANPHV